MFAGWPPTSWKSANWLKGDTNVDKIANLNLQQLSK
jgi:hypothetical protein